MCVKVYMAGAAFLFVSCICQREYHGLVLDTATRQPLAGVVISNVHYPVKDEPDFSIVTDSTGAFRFTFGKRGFIGCREEMIQLRMEEYIGFLIDRQENMDTVWMERSEALYPD